MAKKRIEDCRSGKDFCKYAKKIARTNPNVTFETGRGSHNKVKIDGYGQTVIPHHNNDLGRGLRSVLVKFFLGAGFILVLAFLIIY